MALAKNVIKTLYSFSTICGVALGIALHDLHELWCPPPRPAHGRCHAPVVGEGFRPDVFRLLMWFIR